MDTHLPDAPLFDDFFGINGLNGKLLSTVRLAAVFGGF